MTDRVNLVDAYENRSVIAKLVGMEERIDGAESTMQSLLDEATTQADAASSSAATAATRASSAAASATSAKASADSAASVLANVVKKDGETSQTIAGDITVTGGITIDGELEAAGAAFENSSGDLVISPESRLIVKTGAGENQEMVVGTDSVIVDKLLESTTPSASADVKTAANIEYVSSTDGRNNLVHTNSNERISGMKTANVCSYYGSIPTLASGTYEVIADFGAVTSVLFTASFACRNWMSVGIGSYDGSAFTFTAVSNRSDTGYVNLAMATVDGNLCLLARRSSTPGTAITANIFGASSGANNIVPTIYATGGRVVTPGSVTDVTLTVVS